MHPDATLISEMQRARLLAQFAHFYQRDKSDSDYFIAHVQSVANRVVARAEEIGLTDDDFIIAQTVALLHDVPEDFEETRIAFDMIVEWGFSDEVIDTLGLVTKAKGQSRVDYIAGVMTSPIALVVKAADLDSNTMPSRLRRLDLDDQIRLLEKYLRDFEQMGLSPRWSLTTMLATAREKKEGLSA